MSSETNDAIDAYEPESRRDGDPVASLISAPNPDLERGWAPADDSNGVVGDAQSANPEGNTTAQSDEVGQTPADFAQLNEVIAALNAVEAQVQRFHTRAESYEQIVRQMQSRIEQLQGDQVQALLKPVIQRLARLHAQAAEASRAASERGETKANDFDYFVLAIEDALGLIGIESVGAVPSQEFDSGKHHAIRSVGTHEPEQDKRIERVLVQGFTYLGAPRVLLPAQVSVFSYERLQSIEPEGAAVHSPENESIEGVSVE